MAGPADRGRPGRPGTFLQSLPDDRRQALLLTALHQVRGDALWDALERSPTALAVARDEGLKKGVSSVLSLQAGSERAIDVLFDPASGFTPDEIAKYC